MDNSKKEGGIVQLVVVLGLITFICALLLGVINGVTADKIAQNAVETRDHSDMSFVIFVMSLRHRLILPAMNSAG